MKTKIFALCVVLVAAVAGCVQVTGPYYLNQEKYDDGIEAMQASLVENPSDAASAYWLGRLYMAKEEPARALPAFRKAVALEPDNADALFWEGVAHWALLDFKAEREAYGRALQLDPDHISANLYMGHSLYDEGRWEPALIRYEKVIELDEYNPEALLGRAETLYELGRDDEARTAFRQYLEYYPDGQAGFEAVDRLNELGDYSWRNYLIGRRKVSMVAPALKPGTDELDSDAKPSLQLLAEMMDTNRELVMHIVAYSKGDRERARLLARRTKEYLVGWSTTLDPDRLRTSWFGVGEVVETGQGRTVLEESVNLIPAVR